VEDAFGEVDENPVGLELQKEFPEMLCCSCSSGDREKTRTSSKYAKQKSRSSRMSSMNRWNVWAAFRKPNAMNGNSNRPKGCGDGSFIDVCRVDGNLVVGPHQVDLRKCGTPRKMVGVVVDVPDRVSGLERSER
jgi:hypothetical protein